MVGIEAVGLSLEIMLNVGVLTVLGAGAASVGAPLRALADPTGVCDQGRGTGWITQEPVRPHDLPRETAVWLTATEPARSSGVAPCRWKRTNERRVEPDAEAIRRRVRGMGSRSAFIVPLTPGNSVHEDPVEEKGLPHGQCPHVRETLIRPRHPLRTGRRSTLWIRRHPSPGRDRRSSR